MKILISTKSVNQPKDSFKQAKSQFHQPIAWLIDWSVKIVLSNTKSIEANECKVCIYAGRTWCSSSRKVTCSQILVFKGDCESDGGVQPVWEGKRWYGERESNWELWNIWGKIEHNFREDRVCNCAEEKYAIDGKRKLQKDERFSMMMMMEVFVRSLEGGRVAGALPQSPDVQPSRRGTYMHVEQVRSYVWTYNRLVVHTHTHAHVA